MPVVDGRSPISRLVRDALHPGAVQWALVNNSPRSASLSIFGVTACGWPPRTPTQSFKSSTAIKRMLRGDAISSALVPDENAGDASDNANKETRAVANLEARPDISTSEVDIWISETLKLALEKSE